MSNCKYHNVKLEICKIGEYGGTPTVDDCLECSRYDGPDRGLGDKISKVLNKTGLPKLFKAVTPNCGCGKRRKALNQKFPCKDKTNA
tara:strand:+ start:187 stop:447 length:261 start_codon:yes stop_codon:yes gene_type:complete